MTALSLLQAISCFLLPLDLKYLILKKSQTPAAAASVTVRSIAFLKHTTDRLDLKCHQECILSLRGIVCFLLSFPP